MRENCRMAKKNILVVDDELSIREFFSIMLKKEGYEVSLSSNGKEALKVIKKQTFDMVISDIKMPEMSGIELLREVMNINPNLIVIMITAYASAESAVEAMKLGAYDYIIKPFKVDEIRIIIENAFENTDLKTENILLRKELGESYQFGSIVGASDSMLAIYSLIKRVATTDTNVLITGESGTGKELVAKAVHYNGSRRNKPFVTVNCSAIPETLMESELFGHKKGSFTGAISDRKGLFHVADSGTIFLDEIGEIPPHIQVKLLRVIQERTFRPVGATNDVSVNIRIICATNKKLEHELKKGTFREDLYYRLNVVNIQIPPLRERKGDIEILANFFLNKYSVALKKKVMKISNEAKNYLKNYKYPGNVRELENIIERAIALELTGIVMPESLSSEITGKSVGVISTPGNIELTDDGIDLDAIISNIERAILLQALARTGGVKKHAAKLLGITFRSMRYRLEKHSLDSPDSRQED